MEIIYHQSTLLAHNQDSCVASDKNRPVIAADAEDCITEFFTNNNEANIAFCKSLFAYRAAYLKSSEDSSAWLIACDSSWDGLTDLPPLSLNCCKLRHGSFTTTPTDEETEKWIVNCFKDPEVKLAILSEVRGRIIVALMRNGANIITIAGSGT